MLKQEIKILLSAIMFYTRIPVPKSIGYSSSNLNKTTRYLPFIGYIVGGIGSLVYFGMQVLFNTDISAIGALSVMVLLTGAFHEDAFADFCDGFGGGYTREKILSIMKDSQIGTYGAVGLCLLFLFKYVIFRNIDPVVFPIVLISAHVLSRFIVVILMYTSQYAGVTELSKSKHAIGKKSVSVFIISMLWIIPLFYFTGIKPLIYIIPVQLMVLIYFRYYIHKKIGGYTGDVLGTLQQLSEVFFYLSFLAYYTLK